jgi:hypothetical protein
LEETSRRLAAQAPDGDLVGDLVDLRIAKHGVVANVSTIRATNESLSSLLDVFA